MWFSPVSENPGLDPETLCLDGRFNHFHQLQCRLDFIRSVVTVHDRIIWVANALWHWEFLSVALLFPSSLFRFALKDGQLWLGHQQALMVSAPCNRSVYLVLTCYHIAGNFRGRQLSRINRKKIFAGKTFADFSLLTPKDAAPPNFVKNHEICKSFVPRNLFAVWYFVCSICVTAHNLPSSTKVISSCMLCVCVCRCGQVLQRTQHSPLTEKPASDGLPRYVGLPRLPTV